MAYSYARRNEIARSKGFKDYSEYRRVTEYARGSIDFQRIIGPTVGGRTGANLDMARLFYQAFVEGDQDDYSLQIRRGRPIIRTVRGKPKGAKAKWLIEVARYVDDTDEWRRRYPNGIREWGPVHHVAAAA